jgi:diguanylate cyclase (GGDEF)-like protein
MAMTDALTDVGTRRRFQVEGRFLYEAAHRKDQTIAAMMIDIDHFKSVNDRFGHAAGDIVLKRVAEACGSDLRGSDLLARYGGEEFVVLLPEAGTREAAAAAERMRRRIESIDHPEINGAVTVSIGIACAVPGAPGTFDAFVQRADEALYHAKAEGRNRVVLNGCPDPSPT